MRKDARENNELRHVTIETNYLKHPEGSVLVTFGDTKVICNATIETKVPPFIRGQGKGWIHAEYAMLPRATNTRTIRESAKGKLTGRTMEIQRLIARTLRSIVDLDKLGERAITIDCDVIQADGGTRTASITGAFVAMKLAILTLLESGQITENPIKENIAAISVGITERNEVLLDLDYSEDSTAAVDMNIVMTASGKFSEIQGTGEESTFSGAQLMDMLEIGEKGIEELIHIQNEAINKDDEKHTEHDLVLSDTVLIATKNKGKAREFETLFAKKGIKIKTLLDYPEIPEVEETGTTFAENALLKAETIANRLNVMVLADDSGLKVDALEGRPGIFSARYAGEPKSDAANNAKLLHDLTDVPSNLRTAQFHCTLALAYPDKQSLVVEGEVEGTILGIPRGENGFGYDSLFYATDSGKSMAELSEMEKNKISHRAQALVKLDQVWDNWLSTQTNK